jgi:hypothetical protein
METCAIYFIPDFTSSGTDLTTLSTLPLQQTGPQLLIATSADPLQRSILPSTMCSCYSATYTNKRGPHTEVLNKQFLHTAFIHYPREAHQGEGRLWVMTLPFHIMLQVFCH